MEDKRNSFEETLRKKYSEKTHDVSQEFWERLQPALEKKNIFGKKVNEPRHHYIRNFSIAASLAAILIGAYFLFFKNDINHTASTADASKVATKEISEKEQHVDSRPQQSKHIRSEDAMDEVRKEKPFRKNEIMPSQTKVVRYIAKGEKNDFYLPDSSRIYLNKNSELVYLEDRKVELNGEAFFEVNPDPRRQFEIICGEARVVVLGTSFNVCMKDSGQVEVAVYTGRVSFYSFQKPDKKLLLVKGGHGILYGDGKVAMLESKDLNVLAWKEETLVFNNVPLDNVVMNLEKYFSIKIRLSDPNLNKCLFTGTFKKPELSKILKVLGATLNIAIEQKNGEYIFTGEACK